MPENIKAKWAAGNLVFDDIVDTAGIHFGLDADGLDIKFFGDTASAYMLWDASADDLVFSGAAGFNLSGTGALTCAGLVTITNATEATNTTTAALVVTGGIANGADCYFGDDIFLTSGAVLNFNAGDVTLTHASNVLTLAGGGLTLGSSGSGEDLILYGDTAGKYIQWQASVNGMYFVGGATLNVVSGTATSLGGALNVSGNIVCAGVGDFAGYISTATTLNAGGNIAGAGTLAITGGSTLGGAVSCNSTLNASGVTTISNATEATSTTGAALVVTGGIGCGGDVYLGDDVFLTSGAVLNFNAGDVTITHSANALALAGGCLNIATSGSPYSYTAGTPVFTLYATTSNDTTTNAQPFLVDSVLTGAGGYGGRSIFRTYTNVASGTNIMPLKSFMEYGDSGSTSGFSTAFCGELQMPDASVNGSYYVVELEYVAGGASTTTQGSLGNSDAGFIYFGNSGDTDGDFDAHGFLFRIGGLTSGSTKLLYNNTLKMGIGSTTWYMPLSSAEGTYTSAYPVNLTYGGAAFDITSTTTAAAVVASITVTDTGTITSGRGIGLGVYYTANGTHSGTYGVRSTRVNTTISAAVPNVIIADWYMATIADKAIDYIFGLSSYWEDYGNAVGGLCMIDLGLNSVHATTSNRHTFIRCREHSTIQDDSSILRLEGDSAAEFLVWFDTGASGTCKIIESGSHETTSDYKVKVYIEGVGDRYIELKP